MFVRKLKDSNFDFEKVMDSDIKDAIQILSDSTNGTFVSDNQKLGVLDNSIFDAIFSLFPNDPIVIKIDKEREEEYSEIVNDGWNTEISEEVFTINVINNPSTPVTAQLFPAFDEGGKTLLTLPDTTKTMDKEVSEDRYFEMLGAVPPIYITTLNGESLKGAFALGEAESQINTESGLKDAYAVFYKKDDLYFEVDGLVYFTEPGVAVKAERTYKIDIWNSKSLAHIGSFEKYSIEDAIKHALEVSSSGETFTEIYHNGNKIGEVENGKYREWFKKKNFTEANSETEISRYTLKSNKQIKLLKKGDVYEVIVISTLTGDRTLEYPRTKNKDTAAKNYIEAIGKYGESKIISKGAFLDWIEKNEMNIDSLHEYAEEQGVNMDIQNFAKGGKTKKVSSYPKKGHILDKFAGLGEGIEPVRETGVFINTDIFTTGGDYILGGFDTKDLDNIEVQGDPTVLSILKVKLLFRSRIEKAVERFKSEIEENFRARVGHKSPTDYEVQNEFDGEIRNLLETYLSLSPSEITDTSVEAVVDLIIENQSSQAWLNTVGERIEKFTSVVVFDGITINKIDQSKVTIDDAEDHTKFASLEQIMEQLHSITEKS